MKKSNGFTLLELIAVIVILALLAVIALPRFLNISDAARKATVEGTAAAFQNGIDIAHASWLSHGGVNNVVDVVDYLDFNKLGFPIGVDKGADSKMTKPYNIGKTEAACARIFEAVLNTDLKVEPLEGGAAGADFYTEREMISVVNANGVERMYLAQCNYYHKEQSVNAKYKFAYDSGNGVVTTYTQTKEKS